MGKKGRVGVGWWEGTGFEYDGRYLGVRCSRCGHFESLGGRRWRTLRRIAVNHVRKWDRSVLRQRRVLLKLRKAIDDLEAQRARVARVFLLENVYLTRRELRQIFGVLGADCPPADLVYGGRSYWSKDTVRAWIESHKDPKS